MFGDIQSPPYEALPMAGAYAMSAPHTAVPVLDKIYYTPAPQMRGRVSPILHGGGAHFAAATMGKTIITHPHSG